MSLTLHFHPLSSFCHKVLIALYEKGVGFEPVIVDLGDPAQAAALRKLSPMGKMPALADGERGETVSETTIMLEWLDARFPQPPRLVPADPEAARTARYWDRFFDLYVHLPMQAIVADRLRPEASRDPYGVEKGRAQLRDACAVVEQHVAGKTWALGDDFTMADCAAAPALFYADTVEPFGDRFPEAKAYLIRLMTRPSFARVLREAAPYFRFYPLDPKPDISILDRSAA